MKKVILILGVFSTAVLLYSAVLEKMNFDKPDFVYELDMGLNNISGLASSTDGRLFANNNEIGSIFELDPKNGRIIKWFWLGQSKVYDDFEATAVVDKTFYLITSKGFLFKFYEQPDGKYTQYTKFTTGLSGSSEGMCYEPKTNSLLIASKNSGEIYSFNLKTEKISDKPRFIIDLDNLSKKYKIKNFSPSGIERDPDSGNFLLLSSDAKGILEVSPAGKTISYQQLKNENHPQPKCITILNKTVFIGDAASGKKPVLTGYKLKQN